MKNILVVNCKILYSLALFLVSSSAWAVDCSSEQIELRSQAEIDSFQAMVGPCDLVRGSLLISGGDIIDLQPLSGLTEIRGELSISNNANLASLEGLSGLRNVYTLYLNNNDKIPDLKGLTSLETIAIEFSVSNNQSLKTLEGLTALDSVGLFLEIDFNPMLTSLQALREVSFLYDADIRISNNGELTSLAGVPSAKRVMRLEILGNEKLKNLSGIQVEDGTLVGRVSIQQNASLRNLAGMEWLTSTLDLTVYRNPQLIDFTGLSGLTTAESISISENDSLLSLGGMEQLHSVVDLPGGLDPDSPFVGTARVSMNPVLENLQAWSSLRASGAFDVIDNANLTDCVGMSALLDVIDHDLPGPGPGVAQIPDVSRSVALSGNGNGCNSIEEIAPRPDVASTLTGSWYSPASSGEGFMIHAVSEHIPPVAGISPGQPGLAVGYFYGYDPNGERFWLIGTHQGPMNWGEAIEFETTEVADGRFEGFDSMAVIRSEWGTFSFLPENCVAGDITMRGEFTAQPGVHEKRLEVVRLANVSGDYCSDQAPSDMTDSITGSWYDPVTSGQGFSIHHISSDRGIVYFYGFDSQQAPLWLIGVWTTPLVQGEEIEIEMARVSGGTFAVVDPEQVLRETWGTLLLRMDECYSAYAELDGLDGKQIFFMAQLAGSLSLECQG